MLQSECSNRILLLEGTAMKNSVTIKEMTRAEENHMIRTNEIVTLYHEMCIRDSPDPVPGQPEGEDPVKGRDHLAHRAAEGMPFCEPVSVCDGPLPLGGAAA